MKLTPKITLVFILYAAALLASVAWLAYTSGKESLRSATVSELQSTATEKQSALNEWVEEKRTDIFILAGSPTIIEIVTALRAASSGMPEAQAAHDHFLTSGRRETRSTSARNSSPRACRSFGITWVGKSSSLSAYMECVSPGAELERHWTLIGPIVDSGGVPLTRYFGTSRRLCAAWCETAWFTHRPSRRARHRRRSASPRKRRPQAER